MKKKPSCYQLFIEKECFVKFDIPTSTEEYYKEREISEKNITIVPLCLFREDLLPDSQTQKNCSIDTYANSLLNQLFLHYKYENNNAKFYSEPTPWTQSYQKSDCVVLYMKMKQESQYEL